MFRAPLLRPLVALLSFVAVVAVVASSAAAQPGPDGDETPTTEVGVPVPVPPEDPPVDGPAEPGGEPVPAEPEPIIDPIVPVTPLVEPDFTLLEPQTTPISGVVATDDPTTIIVTFQAGPPACAGLYDVIVNEKDDEVRIGVRTGTVPPGDQLCILVVQEYATVLTLSEPVGDRAVVDLYAADLPAQDVAAVFFGAWLDGDDERMAAYGSPDATQAAIEARIEDDAATWAFSRCEGAAGSVYCSWVAPGEQVVVRVANVDSVRKDRRVREFVRSDLTAADTAAAFVASWQAGSDDALTMVGTPGAAAAAADLDGLASEPWSFDGCSTVDDVTSCIYSDELGSQLTVVVTEDAEGPPTVSDVAVVIADPLPVEPGEPDDDPDVAEPDVAEPDVEPGLPADEAGATAGG